MVNIGRYWNGILMYVLSTRTFGMYHMSLETHTVHNTQVCSHARVCFGEFVIRGRRQSSNILPRAGVRGFGVSPSVYFHSVNKAGASGPDTLLSTPQA